MSIYPSFQQPSWYRAMTLTERAHALPRDLRSAMEDPEAARIAQRRLDRWRAQPPFADEAAFHRRLASDGLTPATFERVLGEPIEHVAARSTEVVHWLPALERALHFPCSGAPVALPEKFVGVPSAGFLELVRPMLEQARERLRRAACELAAGIAEPPFDPMQVDALLAPALAEPLLVMVMRTLVLELNVAKLQGQLVGATPVDRFASFIARLRQPDVALAILAEYPVLARQLAQRIDAWVEVGRELLGHIIADLPEIRARFSPDREIGPLIDFHGNAGDSHRGGRTVGIATFGSGLQLVYKPRSLAVEAHIQDLLGWLNQRGATPPFRTIAVLDRGDHGWTEFVAHAPCTSPDQIERFYTRQGANLALLYALGATDVHFENVIAAGEHPVLIDLEGVFRPVFRDELATSLVMKESVFRTNLLPMRLSAGGDYAGMDISGLSSPHGMLTAQEVPTWDDAHQDTMPFVRRRVPMNGASNQPRLDGKPVEATAHLGALRAGFDATYDLLTEHRDALVAADGPIQRFAGDAVRVIMRDTRAYLQLLGELFHPDALRDGLDRDRVLDHLWSATAQAPHLLAFVRSERGALARGDVPLFTIRCDGLDIASDAGGRITGCVATTGLARVRWRLARLGPSDRARQQWCIDAAFATMAGGPSPARAGAVRDDGGRRSARGEERDRLVAAAAALADRIAAAAFWEGDIVGWHVLRQIDERHWTVSASDLDLYGGVPGIAVFLAELGCVTGDDRHAELVARCVATLRHAIAARRSASNPVASSRRDACPVDSIGGFDGWGGLIYAFARLATTLGDRSLLRDAEAIVELLPPLVAADAALDVVSGVAGCLAGLLVLHAAAPSSRTLAAAVACGEHLLARACTIDDGLAWHTAIAARPLCGLAHGASGIAGALLGLFRVTRDPRLQAAAIQAFRFERSQWSADAGTWLDRRGLADAAARPADCIWCHGAPGIGLVRTRAIAQIGDAGLRAELIDDLSRATAATVRAGLVGNHALCHGDLGNLELLLEASALGDPRPRGELVRRRAAILEAIERRGRALCATPRAHETPGMMLGLAGIGYGLLRLADPAGVPSLLLLEGPSELGSTIDHT